MRTTRKRLLKIGWCKSAKTEAAHESVRLFLDIWGPPVSNSCMTSGSVEHNANALELFNECRETDISLGRAFYLVCINPLRAAFAFY